MFENCMPICLTPAVSSLVFSDGAVSQKKPAESNQVPQTDEQRPPSPPGSPPLAPNENTQQSSSETQPSQDLSPAVAAALLQLISQQDSESGASQRSKDPSPAVDAPARDQPPTSPWSADSSPKPSTAAEAPAGLVTTTTATTAQFPKDQDLRFSH